MFYNAFFVIESVILIILRYRRALFDKNMFTLQQNGLSTYLYI